MNLTKNPDCKKRAKSSRRCKRKSAGESDLPSKRQRGAIEIESLTEPILTENDQEQTTQQSCMIIPSQLRLIMLSALITQKMSRKNTKKILIFFATQDIADFHHNILIQLIATPFEKKKTRSYDWGDEEDEDDIWLPNVNFFNLQEDMSDIRKSSIVQEFNAARSGILLCTDKSLVNLNLTHLDLIVHHSAPSKMIDYKRRTEIEKGESVMFLSGSERKFLKLLKKNKIVIKKLDFKKCLEEVELPVGEGQSEAKKVKILQHKIENLLTDESLKFAAIKALSSWSTKIISDKDLSNPVHRDLINQRLKHIASSFGLSKLPDLVEEKLLDKIKTYEKKL